MTESDWFHRWKSAADAKVQLYCFPHAGAGTAAVKALAEAAPEWLDVVAVCLPGREARFLDDLPETLEQVAVEVVTELQKQYAEWKRPILLMGQCSGAVLAYEVAIRLQDVALQGLISCSRPAPNVPVEVVDLSLSDQALIEEVVQLGGVNPEVAAEPMLMELLVPTLRGDFGLVQGYLREPVAGLDVPLLAVRGTEDAVMNAELLQSWKPFTTGDLMMQEVAGGHFLFDGGAEALLAAIESFVETITVSTEQGGESVVAGS